MVCDKLVARKRQVREVKENGQGLTWRPKPSASAAAKRMSACSLHRCLRIAARKASGSSQEQSSQMSRAASAFAGSGSCCASHRIVTSSMFLELTPVTKNTGTLASVIGFLLLLDTINRTTFGELGKSRDRHEELL